MDRLTYEQIIHEDAPEPAQLKRLASIGVSSAASRRRLKTLNKSKRAHYFIEEMDFMGEPVEGLSSDFPTEVRHRMAGRIGVSLVNDYEKIWSLNYFDTYWLNSEHGGWQASRALYRFKWDRNKTLLAERSLRLVSSEVNNDVIDIADAVDGFRVMDDEAAFLYAKEDFRRITAEDCKILIDDSQEYFSLLNAQQRVDR